MGSCNKPSAEEAARNHARQYRTAVGMLYWVNRNTMVELSTRLNYLSRVMAHPSDQAFECALHMIQWCFQERERGLIYRSDAPVTPTTWYDASNDTDPIDSLAIGGGLTVMCGANVISTCGKLLHVGNAGSSHTEYMQLERSTRSIMWLRQLLQSMQIFRATASEVDPVVRDFIKVSRLPNSTPSYTDTRTGHVLRWLTTTEINRLSPSTFHDDANPAVGTWAIVTELGTGDIITLAATPSRRGQHGPSGTVVWSTPDGSGNFITNTSMRVFDAVGISSIVSAPSLLIGDNITAKKWASVDTVTPGNKHIRIAYHWIKEHVRDQDIDLRDTPSKLNLADFLTKNLNGPAIRAFADSASGYAELPAIPTKT